jgi:hypothetical protein
MGWGLLISSPYLETTLVWLAKLGLVDWLG